MEKETATDDISKLIVPYHLQGPEPLDKRKWYLQDEYLQPPTELNNLHEVQDYGISTGDVLSAAHEGNTLELGRLLARGGCVNAVGGFGKTPLHYAVESGHQQTVQYCLSATLSSSFPTVFCGLAASACKSFSNRERLPTALA